MTQPPDERDPSEPVPDPPSPEPPSGEAPTQAWTPAPPAAASVATPGWGAPPPAPDPGPPTPAASPLLSSEPATGPGPEVAWAAPVAAPDVGAPGLTWADTPSRVVAFFLDNILIVFVSGIVVTLLGVPRVPTQPGQAIDPTANSVLTLIITLIGAAYFIASWSGGRRATLGQRLFNIQVGNAFDGRALTTTQAVKRWIGLGSFLGLLAAVPSSAAYGAASLVQVVWAIVLLISTTSSPTKQGLHDRFANSALVRPAGAGTGLAMTCLIILVALFVVSILSIVALIFLGGQVSRILSTVGESI